MRIRTLLNPFKSPQQFSKTEWSEVFPNYSGTLDVEVGFGTGSFIERYAQACSSRSIVGFEIRQKMVELAQEKVVGLEHKNAFLVWGNGQAGLRDMFDDASIDRIIVLHPDPWPRRRHHKRRVLSQDFLERVHQKLKPGGCFYLATDVEELWYDMLSTIQSSEKFEMIQDENFWEEHYQSRWKELSLEGNRTISFGTFRVSK